jgi:hypothetical protein
MAKQLQSIKSCLADLLNQQANKLKLNHLYPANLAACQIITATGIYFIPS